MPDLAQAIRDLRTFKAQLAATTEALSGPRMRWRSVQDRISAMCFTLDRENQIVRSWRPLGVANIATLDAERTLFLADAGPLLPEEKTLKEAVRKAEIELKEAQRQAEKPEASAANPTRNHAQMDLF